MDISSCGNADGNRQHLQREKSQINSPLFRYAELFIGKIRLKDAQDFNKSVTDFKYLVLLCVMSCFPCGRGGSARAQRRRLAPFRSALLHS